VENAYKNLSATVINQAFADLKSDKISERHSATRFFKNADFRTWADVLSIDHGVLLKKYHGIIEEIIFNDLHIKTKHAKEKADLCALQQTVVIAWPTPQAGRGRGMVI